MNGEFPAQDIVRECFQKVLVPAIPQAARNGDAVVGVLAAGDVEHEKLPVDDASASPDFRAGRAEEGITHGSLATTVTDRAEAGAVAATFD